jgi:hypothetical protein
MVVTGRMSGTTAERLTRSDAKDWTSIVKTRPTVTPTELGIYD